MELVLVYVEWPRLQITYEELKLFDDFKTCPLGSSLQITYEELKQR